MLEILALEQITFLNVYLNDMSPLMSPRPQSDRKRCEVDMSDTDNYSRKDELTVFEVEGVDESGDGKMLIKEVYIKG